jgi:hypothetical protein
LGWKYAKLYCKTAHSSELDLKNCHVQIISFGTGEPNAASNVIELSWLKKRWNSIVHLATETWKMLNEKPKKNKKSTILQKIGAVFFKIYRVLYFFVRALLWPLLVILEGIFMPLKWIFNKTWGRFLLWAFTSNSGVYSVIRRLLLVDPFEIKCRSDYTHEKFLKKYAKRQARNGKESEKEHPIFEYNRVQFDVTKEQLEGMDDCSEDNVQSLVKSAENFIFNQKTGEYSDEFNNLLKMFDQTPMTGGMPNIVPELENEKLPSDSRFSKILRKIHAEIGAAFKISKKTLNSLEDKPLENIA